MSKPTSYNTQKPVGSQQVGGQQPDLSTLTNLLLDISDRLTKIEQAQSGSQTITRRNSNPQITTYRLTDYPELSPSPMSPLSPNPDEVTPLSPSKQTPISRDTAGKRFAYMLAPITTVQKPRPPADQNPLYWLTSVIPQLATDSHPKPALHFDVKSQAHPAGGWQGAAVYGDVQVATKRSFPTLDQLRHHLARKMWKLLLAVLPPKVRAKLVDRLPFRIDLTQYGIEPNPGPWSRTAANANTIYYNPSGTSTIVQAYMIARVRGSTPTDGFTVMQSPGLWVRLRLGLRWHHNAGSVDPMARFIRVEWLPTANMNLTGWATTGTASQTALPFTFTGSTGYEVYRSGTSQGTVFYPPEWATSVDIYKFINSSSDDFALALTGGYYNQTVNAFPGWLDWSVETDVFDEYPELMRLNSSISTTVTNSVMVKSDPANQLSVWPGASFPVSTSAPLTIANVPGAKLKVEASGDPKQDYPIWTCDRRYFPPTADLTKYGIEPNPGPASEWIVLCALWALAAHMCCPLDLCRYGIEPNPGPVKWGFTADDWFDFDHLNEAIWREEVQSCKEGEFGKLDALIRTGVKNFCSPLSYYALVLTLEGEDTDEPYPPSEKVPLDTLDQDLALHSSPQYDGPVIKKKPPKPTGSPRPGPSSSPKERKARRRSLAPEEQEREDHAKMTRIASAKCATPGMMARWLYGGGGLGLDRRWARDLLKFTSWGSRILGGSYTSLDDVLVANYVNEQMHDCDRFMAIINAIGKLRPVTYSAAWPGFGEWRFSKEVCDKWREYNVYSPQSGLPTSGVGDSSEADATRNNQETHSTNGNIEKWYSTGKRKVEADQHNARMHALNGNTMDLHGNKFVKTMSDYLVNSAVPDIDKMIQPSSRAGRPLNPKEAAARVNGTWGPQGASSAQVPTNDFLRSQILTAANVLVPITLIDIPGLYLQPRSYRTGGAANAGLYEWPAGAAATTQWILCGTVRDSASAVTQTPLYTDCRERIINTDIKADRLLPNGFRPIDIYLVGNAYASGVVSGDRLTNPFLKGCLLATTLRWNSQSPTLPLSGVTSGIDSFSIISDRTVVPTLNYNVINNAGTGGRVYPPAAAGVWREDCGGAASFFPWGLGLRAPTPNPNLPIAWGAQAGQGVFSIHTSIKSVPAADRDNALYFSKTLLSCVETSDPTLSFAILLMLFAPYPFGIHQVTIPTTFLDGTSGSANTYYIPYSNLVSLPGSGVLRIVLPIRDGSNLKNETPGDASYNLVVQPKAGPTASTAIPAGTLITASVGDGSGSGNSLYEYSLSEFLYTWFAGNTIGVTHINNVLITLASLTGRHADLTFAREVAAAMSVRYTPLLEITRPNTVGNLSSAATATNGGDVKSFLLDHTTNTPFGFVASAAPASPAPWARSDVNDLVIPGSNHSWLSGVVIGALSPSALSVDTEISFINFTDLDYLRDCRYVALGYACTYSILFRMLSYPKALLDNIYNDVALPIVYGLLQGFWITHMFDERYPQSLIAKHHSALDCLHSYALGYDAARDAAGLTIFARINYPRRGVWEAWYISASTSTTLSSPPITYALATARVIHTTLVPQTIPDVWIHQTCLRIPNAMQPFLGPRDLLCGVSVSDADVQQPGFVYFSIPLVPSRRTSDIATERVLSMPFHEQFHSRLFWHSTTLTTTAIFRSDGISLSGPAGVGNNVGLTTGGILCPLARPPDVFSWAGTGAFNPTVHNKLMYRLAVANTLWIPGCTRAGQMVWAGVLPNEADTASQMLAARSFAIMEVVVFPHHKITPNRILGGGMVLDNRFNIAGIAQGGPPENWNGPSSGGVDGGPPPGGQVGGESVSGGGSGQSGPSSGKGPSTKDGTGLGDQGVAPAGLGGPTTISPTQTTVTITPGHTPANTTVSVSGSGASPPSTTHSSSTQDIGKTFVREVAAQAIAGIATKALTGAAELTVGLGGMILSDGNGAPVAAGAILDGAMRLGDALNLS